MRESPVVARGAQERYRRAVSDVPFVLAELGYLETAPERPFNYMYEPPDGAAWHNCEYEMREVRVADARDLSSSPSVHTEGFELWDAPSDVLDFDDEDAIIRRYYREAEELACAACGADRAYVFDHVVRRREPGRPALTFGRYGDGRRPAAVGRVHNDYTEDSGRQRLSLVLGSTVEATRSVERFAIVNLWRSIRGPVQDTPLAVCDARSVSAVDLVATEIRYPERSGYIYLLSYAPRHRWWYYRDMDRHEVLIFKQYDSQVSGVARYTPHAAFDHPDMPPDAPLRESIELRCLVVYD